MAGDDRPERSERVREPPQGLKFPSGGYLKDHAALAREQDPAAVKKHRSAPQPFGKDQGGRRHLRHIDPAVEPVADQAVMGVQKKDMRLVIHSVCAERALRVCGEFRDIIEAAAVLCGLNAPGAQKGEGLLPAGAP